MKKTLKIPVFPSPNCPLTHHIHYEGAGYDMAADFADDADLKKGREGIAEIAESRKEEERSKHQAQHHNSLFNLRNLRNLRLRLLSLLLGSAALGTRPNGLDYPVPRGRIRAEVNAP